MGHMKYRETADPLETRFILLALMGLPFWASYLASKGSVEISIIVFTIWLFAYVPLSRWLNKERLVRKHFSILIAGVMSAFYGVVLYGSATT